MNFCIDIGNTNIKYAVIKKGEVLYFNKGNKLLVRDIKAINSKFPFEYVALGASGSIPKRLAQHLDKNYHLLLLNAGTKLPISIKYKTPKTLGRDRVAAVIGANSIFPKKTNCVIDIGTCITYDVINSEKEYLGGNIAPGVELRLKSMNDYTARLPLVKRGSLDDLLGDTTEKALQNGATLGTLLEIESFISKVQEQFSNLNIILTGGDAEFFAKKINSQIFVEPNLVLLGLSQIIDFNVHHK